MPVPAVKDSLTAPKQPASNIEGASKQPASTLQAPSIDVSTRPDQQLTYLSTNGKPGYKEAAIAEIARRAGGNVSTTTPVTAGDSVSLPPGQGKETGGSLPKPTLEERKAAALELRKAKEAATKAAEARTIAARAPEVASLADRLKAAAATAVGSRKAALEAGWQGLRRRRRKSLRQSRRKQGRRRSCSVMTSLAK
jgi:hypothetical protein